MTNLKILLTGLISSAVLVTTVWGQEGERRPNRPERPGRQEFGGPGGLGGPVAMERILRSSPLFRALDADGDGVLSAEEIANATKALNALDKDGDGKLSVEELMPPPPAGGRGPEAGPGGRGGEGGPGREGRGGRGAEGGAGGLGAGMLDRFMQLANDQGQIEREDVPERMQTMFDRADANKDGVLDKKELETMAQRMREAMGGNRGEGNRGEGNRGGGNRGEGNRGEGNRGGRGRDDGGAGRGRGGNQPPIPPRRDGAF